MATKNRSAQRTTPSVDEQVAERRHSMRESRAATTERKKEKKQKRDREQTVITSIGGHPIAKASEDFKEQRIVAGWEIRPDATALVVSIVPAGDKKAVDIRQYYLTDDEFWRPTGKGFRLGAGRLSVIAALCELLPELTERVTG
jgi:hypothetical protein